MLHVAILVFLYLYVLTLPPKQEEGGVPVMLGNTETGEGDADPYTLTEVDLLPQPETAEQEASYKKSSRQNPPVSRYISSTIFPARERASPYPTAMPITRSCRFS